MNITEIKYKNFKVKIRKMSKKNALIENCWGLYNPNKSTIYIQENISRKNYLDILLHETAHFIFDKSKIKPKSEEKVAEFIGSEFSKIFLQNPKLINFIKQCTKQNETG